MSEVDEFVALQPKLFGVAYRMLGSVTDAQDVVQEAFLRWQATDRARVRSVDAFLTTTVVRIAIDQLTSARARRESYVGPWLPEPLLVDDDDPARLVELADTLSMAFLVLLETLSPLERAALLLRDVFEYDYDEIAEMLDRTPTTCRQLVSRARRSVAQRRRRFDADHQRGREIARRFAEACLAGDTDGLLALLAADVTLWTDGGGKVKAALRPINGAEKVARFLIGIAPTVPSHARLHEVVLNGQPGLVLTVDDGPIAAATLDILDGRIIALHFVNNPEKLEALALRLSTT
ncbi:MAG: RNA polymerase sigma-70 factor [Acidothermus sp.]|nr:RNA polymerase sigma-70 factor [Acidothermus sp.]MCL6538332.1 RNA polymerase sigma-70 factor [Acidothermus sp.]